MKAILLLSLATFLACGEKEKIIVQEKSQNNANGASYVNWTSITTSDGTYYSDQDVTDDFISDYQGSYTGFKLSNQTKENSFLNMNHSHHRSIGMGFKVGNYNSNNYACNVHIYGEIVQVIPSDKNVGVKNLSGTEEDKYMLIVAIHRGDIVDYRKDKDGNVSSETLRICDRKTTTLINDGNLVKYDYNDKESVKYKEIRVTVDASGNISTTSLNSEPLIFKMNKDSWNYREK